MSSEAVATVMKMMESLPETVQERVVEHLREYIEELQDELQWNSLVERHSHNCLLLLNALNRKLLKDLQNHWTITSYEVRLPSHLFGQRTNRSIKKLGSQPKKHTVCGNKSRFIHLYISNAPTVKKTFGL